MIKLSVFNNADVDLLQALYIMAEHVDDMPYYVEDGKIYMEGGEEDN